MKNISVVLPLYNKKDFILRSINSVLSQNILPSEIIIVNDGSTDGGEKIVESIKCDLIKLINQKNSGEGAARNTGINASQGDLIAFLDADDAWKSNFLAEILELHSEYPEAGLYATACEIVKEDDSIYYPKHNLNLEKHGRGLIRNYIEIALLSLWRDIFLVPSTIAVPKSILKEINGFSTIRSLGVDEDAWLKIALKYPVAWSEKYLVQYFQDDPKRLTGIKRLRCTSEPAISRTAREALANQFVAPEFVDSLREYAARNQLIAARDCLLGGFRNEAIQLLAYAKNTTIYRTQWERAKWLSIFPGKTVSYCWKFKKLLEPKFPIFKKFNFF